MLLEKLLSIKQKKIAKLGGHPEKLDAHDFAALRSGKKPVEEATGDTPEDIEKKKLAISAVSTKMKTEEADDNKMTASDKKQRERYVRSMKKNIQGFKERYGARANNVMYATATKMAMKEQMREELNKPTPSVEEIAKKHGVDASMIENELEKGIKVEMEHTTNKSTAREIALDHLNERPDYYKKLKMHVEGYRVIITEAEGVQEGTDYTPPKLGTVKANLMNTQQPTVQVQVFKHNTLRGDSYWVTHEVKKFKTMDQAQAYVNRINKQGVAESTNQKLAVGSKVYHKDHGTGKVLDYSKGAGSNHWVDVELPHRKGESVRLNRKHVKLVENQDTLNEASLKRNSNEDVPISARTLYAQTYIKHAKTASKAKEAEQKAYDAVHKKHGKDVHDKLKQLHSDVRDYNRRKWGPNEKTQMEGRQSQQHPIPEHDYHKKPDEQLKYIMKDAGEAAIAMKGHSPKAESKYLDQVNDAATVLSYRKRNGMQDWYKKKYGHK